jgi:hypothetical protein
MTDVSPTLSIRSDFHCGFVEPKIGDVKLLIEISRVPGEAELNSLAIEDFLATVRPGAIRDEVVESTQLATVTIRGLGQTGQEVAELLNAERVALSELLHMSGIAVVMTEFVPRLRDAQFRNRQPLPFESAAEGDHPSCVGLKGEYDKIVNRPEVVTGLSLRHVSIIASTIGVGDFGTRNIQPGIGRLVRISVSRTAARSAGATSSSKMIQRELPADGKLVDGKPAGDGWQPVFSGDRLDGWKYEPEYWSNSDGIITGKYDGGPLHHYMYSEKDYGDFEMHATVKISGTNANSGVCIRTKPTSFDNVPGYQVDMGEGYWGCLWDERRDAMVDRFDPAAAKKLVKADDWNHFYIVAKGHYIQGWLNGVKTIDVIHPRGDATGSLGFQLTHGRNRKIHAQFKDLWIRPLD